MPLESKFFTKPKRNQRLEDCLVDDSAHVELTRPREKGPHVSLIQAALFIVLPDVNLGDELGTEEYGPLTADAVFRFKDSRTPKILNVALRQTVPDKIVGKLTIKELDREMLAREGTPTTSPEVSVNAVALSGFSNFRLRRSGGVFSADLSQPLCQMVPVEGFRNLFVVASNKSGNINIRTPSPPHSRAFVAPGVITLRGLNVGEDLGRFTIDGADSNALRIIVRAKSIITVNFHALADTTAKKGAIGFQSRLDSLLRGLNRIYVGQANIRFQRGQFETIDSVNGRKFDFDKPIVVNPRSRDPNLSDPTRQLFSFGAFLPKAIDPVKEFNVFFTPGLIDLPNAAGTSSIFAEKLCWVTTDPRHDEPTFARVVAHEIGHLLGLGHLDSVPGTLMFPTLKRGGDVIPAETLETISIP